MQLESSQLWGTLLPSSHSLHQNRTKHKIQATNLQSRKLKSLLAIVYGISVPACLDYSLCVFNLVLPENFVVVMAWLVWLAGLFFCVYVYLK